METTLDEALYCVRSQKENGTYQGASIGRVAQKFDYLGAHYNEGAYVLFKDDITPGRLIVEMPLNKEDIGIHQQIGSKQTTCFLLYGIKSHLIEKVDTNIEN